MKRNFYVMIALILMVSLLTSPVSAASTAINSPELGQLKVCKVAGAGVVEGQLFTFNVGGSSFNVPAGPGDGGYCVLAGQYPVDTQVTIQEDITAGYYVSHIEVKPDRAVSKDVGHGTAIIKVGSGVTEIIFTNRVIGSPTPTRTPTPLVTPTRRPTNTPTATPNCAPNCTPTPTPIPRGRLQICKEADGVGVSGYFTFNFAGRSVTVPVGACSGLIGVDAGNLTITEEAQAGYSVTDIYTIPADRLINKNLGSRRASVTIVEGNASTQTIVIFRNQVVTQTPTPTGPVFTNTPVTNTPTNTPTGTVTTPTNTPAACQPTVVMPIFPQIPVGSSVEGLGTIDARLNIDAKGTAVHVHEGQAPAVYASIVNGVAVMNAGTVADTGFSDPTTQLAAQAHLYNFTFAPGVSVSNFTLHMLDFGDYNPTGSPSTLVTMTAYNASNAVVSSQQLSYTATGLISPQYGNLSISGDAIAATPGQPGNWTWIVSGSGIVRVVLEFGVGYDPNIGLDLLSFTVECPTSGSTSTPTSTVTVPTNTPTATPTGTVPTPTNTPAACQPEVVTPIFPQIPVGSSVEGLGTVDARLNIDAKDTAVHILEGQVPAVYASTVNGVPLFNAGMVAHRGFSDPTVHSALQPHLYNFTFAPGVSVSNFTLHMLDFGDYNPTGSPSTLVTMTAYNASNAVVSSQQLSYTATGLISPQYGNLSISGDAIAATPGQPGNWTWIVSGSGIVRVVLEEGTGYDPNVGFDLLSFTVECPTSGSTSTPISTVTVPTNTPTATPTGIVPTPTNTPVACLPTVVRPSFPQIPVGSSVEGLGTIDARLNIDAKGTAVHVHEGQAPAVYSSFVNGVGNVANAGTVADTGFSDPTTQLAAQPHLYNFTFAPGVSVSNFTLHMLDFGDYNPTGSPSTLVTMTAYNASNAVVSSQQLSYTATGLISPQYGNLSISGDAIAATPGQPGNWTWIVSGSGIVRVVLEFGVGYDPNIGLDIISFTVECAATVTAPPGATTLVSPTGSVTNTSPTYTWTKVSDASRYYLWVDNAAGNVIQQWYESSAVCGASTCSVTPATTLSGGAHTWWIQTWNSGGHGAWSIPMNFSLPTIAPPGATTLVSPTGSMTNTSPTYTWTKVSDASRYYLWVDNAAGNVIQQWYESSAVCGASTCSVTPATTLSGGAHTWWIQTWNSGGHGAWSIPMNFSVAP